MKYVCKSERMAGEGARIACAVAIAAALLLAAAAQAAPAPRQLKALIVTGQNNHDWRSTTPVLQDILARSGRFEVAVTEHPETATSADFAPYDVIVSNYNNGNGPRWGPAAEQALLDFVRSGRGFVVIHAANNAFTDWPEYVALIGGIWTGQSGHGRQHQFTVRIVDRNHSITRGMADFVHNEDELYHRLEMQPNLHLLATAFSAEDTGGTGRDEPVVWTVDFQGGRCFHCVLGHNAEAMQGAGFAALVQRGAEWAATGQVVPASDAAMLVPQLGAKDASAKYVAKTRLIALGADALAPLMAAVAGDDPGVASEARDTLTWIAQRWAGSSEGGRIAVMVTSFAGPDNPTPMRALAARMLGLMGDAQALPTLMSMLGEEPVREEARRAITQIPGREATDALVSMLSTSGPEFAQDILHALAARGARSAAPAIVRAASAGNMGVRLAAVDALGQMGDASAADPLWQLATQGPAELRPAALDAYLRLASSMVRQARVYRAAAMYRRALGAAPDERRLIAALVGLGRAARQQTAKDLKPFLGAESPRMRVAAAMALGEMPGFDATTALAERLRDAPADLRVTILGLLGRRGDRTATRAVIRTLSEADEGVHVAAVEALGAIGDPAAQEALRRAIETDSAPMRAAAMTAYLSIADAVLESGDSAAAARAYTYALGAAQSPQAKARALTGIGASGGLESLEAVKAALAAPEQEVAAAAMNAFLALGVAAAATGDQSLARQIFEQTLERATRAQALAAVMRLQELGADIDAAALQGFITNWWIIGPFPNENKEAWDKHYFPEQEIALDKQYDLDGQKLAWQFYRASGLEGMVPLDQILNPSDNKAAYLYARVTSPQAQPVRLMVGSDDGVKVWVNGELVFANNADRGVTVDEDAFDAQLKQGANDVLLEVLNGGADWGAVVRITDQQERPLRLEQRQP